MATTPKMSNVTPLPEQNPMPDYGAARTRDARCRGFGVLGFPDSPEAQIGGTLIRKGIVDVDHDNSDGAGA